MGLTNAPPQFDISNKPKITRLDKVPISTTAQVISQLFESTNKKFNQVITKIRVANIQERRILATIPLYIKKVKKKRYILKKKSPIFV